MPANLKSYWLNGRWRWLVPAAAVIAALTAMPQAPRADDSEGDRWPALRKEFFADRDITDEKVPLAIDAPDKAEDAAIVPIAIHISPAIAGDIKTMHVIIDNNPVPLVGKFEFGPAAGDGGRTFSTRVRFDTFSYVRAIAETNDGRLLMTAKFVQAAGGCSAPAIKDFQEAMAHTGEMRLKKMEKPQKFASQRQSAFIMREAEVMLRHPNYSGMQMDKETGNFIPARYVREIDVKRGDDLVFHLQAGISLSTNPNIRFTYGSAGEEELAASANDSDGKTFAAKAGGSGS